VKIGAGHSTIAAAIGATLLARSIWIRQRSLDLNNLVVLITGSSRGLGLALAEECARQGARLVLCARGPDELERARQSVSRYGAKVLAMPCDVAGLPAVQNLVERTINRFGQIDILINNAGIITVGPFREQTPADFATSMDTMFWGMVRTTMAVLPGMRARKQGQIVNITSIGGKVSVPHLLSYSSAKFAAVGFSEGLSTEVAKDGIHVLTVVPGLMRTGSHVNALFKGKNRMEYGWFSLGASLPVSSMSADRAAKRIVTAMRRKETQLILTAQARLLASVHGLFPGFTTNMLKLVDRAMPDAGGIGTDARLGKESESVISESFLTTLGQRAAETWHQYPESANTEDTSSV
jgi:short-subunit dehydrogenase